MELQACLGQIDLVLGSFAKCFGAPGGFVAFRDPDLAPGPDLAPPIPGPDMAAILAGIAVIDSDEGRRRRLRLHGNALRLRNHLMADGLRVLGQPSPLVPVPLPTGLARALTALLASAGPLVPLLQAPLVPGHAPRWRILLSSDHGPADIDDLADLIRDVIRSADRQRHRSGQRVT
jgi:7-keto-8-aminopelargonate synthetase-like enzyme